MLTALSTCALKFNSWIFNLVIYTYWIRQIKILAIVVLLYVRTYLPTRRYIEHCSLKDVAPALRD